MEEDYVNNMYQEHEVVLKQSSDAFVEMISKDTARYGIKGAAQTMLLWVDNYLVEQKKEAVKEKRTHICSKGCDFCCYSEILISDYEFELIKEYIQTYNVDIDWDLVDEQQGTMEENSKLPFAKRKCPLLKDGLCSVYPVRPVVCRAYNSIDTDPKLCKKEYGFKDERNAIHQQQIMILTEGLQIALAIIEKRYDRYIPLLSHKLKQLK